MAEQVSAEVEIGPGGVPKGSNTSDYYRTFNIPERFENPGGCFLPGNVVFSCQKDIAKVQSPAQSPDEWFQGYEHKPVHPMYRTTSQDYGGKPPSVHTMPNVFNCKSQKFSNHLGTCGMYRNHSLNTAKEVSKV